MNGEAVGERLTDLCLKRSRHDLNLALWRQEHPELISWNSDLDRMDVNTDLAFMDDICLVLIGAVEDICMMNLIRRARISYIHT
jgi:hypothetical protein